MLEEKISQQKINALCAKCLHERRLVKLKKLNRLVDILAFGVPTAYFPVRFLAKGTTYGPYIEGAWAVVAGILATISVVKMISRWQDSAERHSKLMGENISLVTQADYLLNSPDTLTPDKAQLFFLLSDNLEKLDRDALGLVKSEEKQNAYREALKESVPNSADIKCPVCKASPWHFKPGLCQTCGNTPVSEH